MPLAVLGVLPLLWNMIKSIWIRTKLSQSIPPEFRYLFSLIPDPASGTVTVVGRIPRLAGLWKISGMKFSASSISSKQRQHPTVYKSLALVRTVARSWRTAVLRMLHRSVRKSSDLSMAALREDGSHMDTVPACRGDDSPNKRFWIRRQRLLHAQWMQLALQCGFDVRANDHEECHWDEEVEDIRIVVDSDMRIHTIPLMMDWDELVWFALGNGVSPFDQCFNKPGGVANSVESVACMKFVEAHDHLAVTMFEGAQRFSWRKACSASYVMVSYSDKGDESQFQPLSGPKRHKHSCIPSYLEFPDTLGFASPPLELDLGCFPGNLDKLRDA